MITEFYPNPNKPKSIFPVTPVKAYDATYNEYWAKKKSCTVEEFIKRDEAYKKAAARAYYNPNEVVYPHTWAEYQKKGKCRILKIDKSYITSDVEWSDKEPIYSIEASSEKNNFAIFRATAGFFTRIPPVEPKDEPKKDAV